MKQTKIFNGFSEKAIEFLGNLEFNNNKEWFLDNKAIYEEYLLKPLKALVSDLSSTMMSIDFEIETRPAVNKTISRIYRDTRFSKNKTPFRSNLWITFKRPEDNWKEYPAYFFEISPEGYSYGMGLYEASPQTMAKFREKIDENPELFKKAISFYKKDKEILLEGNKYVRIFDKTKSSEIQDWYQRKSFYLINKKSVDDTLFSSKLVDELTKKFNSLADLYKYLVDIQIRK